MLMNRDLQLLILIFLLAASSAFGRRERDQLRLPAADDHGNGCGGWNYCGQGSHHRQWPACERSQLRFRAPSVPQRGPAIVEDSNLLSVLGISVSGEEAGEAGRFVATLDLSQMKLPARYKLTDEAVVKAALRCIRNTINEVGEKGIWKIRIVARPKDGAMWSKFEMDYRPHPRR